MSERRFDTEHDTPCPFRLARFGYRRTGEFRQPEVGELYIQPTNGPELEEHEPMILGLCERLEDAPGVPRHIVVPITDEDRAFLESPNGVLAALFGIDPFALRDELAKEQAGA